MDTRTQIKELALLVGRGLKVFIAVHNKICDKSSTLKSIIKNYIGRGTPMADLLVEAETLVPIWDGIAEEVEAFRAKSYDILPQDQHSYFDILTRYVASVRKAVDALVSRQRLLNEGSKGGANNPMTFAAYRQREADFQAASRDYSAIGRELNAAAHIIFK